MGWERRNRSMYYYRKRREGKHVQLVYVGGGEYAVQLAAECALFRQKQREMKKQQSQEIEKVVLGMERVAEGESMVQALYQYAMLASAFHTHHRQWRKKR